MPGSEAAEVFDFIVVGTGAAGSIVAARLAEDGRSTVCVLEAGPPDRNPMIHVPAGFIRTLYDPRVTWQFKTEPSPFINNRQIALTQGRTLGGGTSINGMLYNRGQRSDYDHWGQLGNQGWGYADLLPYFKRTERRVGGGEDTFRGREGRLPVTDIDIKHPLAEAFIAGAAQLGLPVNEDYNGSSAEGVNYCQRTIEHGRRQSTARSFLRPVQTQANVQLLTNARVSAVLIEDGAAVGVVYHRMGGQVPVHARARKEVILSCGSINTAKLLQLSGIGPATLLGSLGIAVQVDLPGVGENLRDHYQIRVVAKTKNVETYNELARGPRLLGQIAKWLLGRPSILGSGPSPLYYSWRSDPSVSAPDIGGVFSPASFRQGRVGELDTVGGMTCGMWQHRPRSVGHVRVASSNARRDPVIQPNYLADEEDRRVTVAGIRLARRLLRSPALSEFLDHEEFPGDRLQSDDELLEVARQFGSTAYHPVGTARMGGAHDPSAVVDDRLRVRGIRSLRVVDASVMPDMPSCNTAAPTMAIAEKASDMIMGRSAPEPIILSEPVQPKI